MADAAQRSAPWQAVQQQTERWLAAQYFERMAEDLRLLLRLGQECGGQPTAVVMDSRTLQSTPESGAWAGYDGAKKRKGSKVHAAVDSLGYLLALNAISMPNRSGQIGFRLRFLLTVKSE